jgi:hypothetical protein
MKWRAIAKQAIRIRTPLLRHVIAVVVSLILFLGGESAHALTFAFSPEPGTPPQAVSGLVEAGKAWSSIFTDDVTLDIGFRFSQEPTGAASTLLQFPYAVVRDALRLDPTSAADFTAVNHLQTGPVLSFLLNLTGDNPNGVGSMIPYLDNNASANNNIIRLTASNAKSLGLDRTNAIGVSTFLGGDVSRDAVIILNPAGIGAPWDFDRSDGITPGTIDFAGIVAHEIGHALGFSSGVDVLDRFFVNPLEDQLTWVNTLDLFRFSEESLQFGQGVIDWTVGNVEKFFSIDGGATPLTQFRTGIVRGDGGFPGHWKSPGTGVMDDVLFTFIGNEAGISPLDITAIDVIGWNLLVAHAPEPGVLSLFIFGSLALVIFSRRRRPSGSGAVFANRISRFAIVPIDH